MEIDRLNILQATRLAMRRALQALPLQPDFLLFDALTLSGLSIPQRSIIKGDGLYLLHRSGLDRCQGDARPPDGRVPPLVSPV